MAKRTATLECTDCGEKFSISAKSPDSISFCPFCGTSIGVPTEDVQEEYFDDDEETDDDE